MRVLALQCFGEILEATMALGHLADRYSWIYSARKARRFSDKRRTTAAPGSAMQTGLAPVKQAKLFLQGEWVDTAETVPVFDKFSGEQIGDVSCASREQVDAAVSAAALSFRNEPLSAHRRA